MNKEQRNQLELMLSALKRDFYHPLQELQLGGFRAEEKLSLKEAAGRERTDYPVGTRWGNPWEYAWMFAEFTLPEEACGERIVMDLNPGGESTLYLNGEPFGTRRRDTVYHAHHYMVDQTVTRCARGGEKFSLAMEVYGGTPLPVSPRGRCASGPVFPEEGVLMTGTGQAEMGRNTFGIWNEEAYQLWLDLTVLLDIYDTQGEHSFVREKVGVTLDSLLDRLDLEQPLPKRREAYRDARRFLEPLMEMKNGTFAPSMGVIANSHLDVAWLWPLAETERKTIRTFAQQLRLLEEYPEARFLASQCVLYEMCRQQEPELFDKIKKAVARGQWIAEGAMWVEPDTNLSGGEALIRQFLYGKRYFREEFGVDSRIAWLPDTFGYTAALPQILAGCEVDGLTTQKIFWTYNDAEPFPYHAFLWKGLDGSTVPCYLHMFYESAVDVKTVMKRWEDRLIQDGSGDFYLPFGYGDGGAGPTRDDMELVCREQDLQGVPRLHYETPAEMFERRTGEKLPVYRGELYFACHRGTYTTQGAVKRGNRRAEQAMRAYELWAACARWAGEQGTLRGGQPVEPGMSGDSQSAEQRGHYQYPAAEIESTWKKVLLNQFHDILPGSSIARVYEEAVKLYGEIMEEAKAGTDAALGSIGTLGTDAALSHGRSGSGSGEAAVLRSCPEEGVTIYHTQSWERRQLVLLDDRFAAGAETWEGEAVPCRKVEDGVLAMVTLPSMGSVSLRPVVAGTETASALDWEGAQSVHEAGQWTAKGTKKEQPVTARAIEDGYVLENDVLRAILHPDGQLASVVTLADGQERLGGMSNCLHLYRDVPRAFDAWDIDSQTEDREVALEGRCESAVILSEGLRAAIRFTTRFGQSVLTQTVSLDAGAARIDFDTEADWQERHKLLKVSFDTGVDAPEAANQIQFGHILRPTHRSDRFAADRFEVCNHGFTALFDATHGAAVLNDCKYGVSMRDSVISLSLLRGAVNPDPGADQGKHQFRYSYYVWEGAFEDSGVVAEAAALNAPVQIAEGCGPKTSFFAVDDSRVVIDTVKLAEDGSGDMILRLYESMNGTRRAVLSSAFAFDQAWLCNMLEEPKTELKAEKNQVELNLHPFEILTLRLQRRKERAYDHEREIS